MAGDPTTVETPPSSCPVCRYAMDRATDVAGSGAMPVPGDYSLCLNCASVLVFDDALALAHPSHEQLQQAPREIWAMQQRMKTVAKVAPRYERLPCGCLVGSDTIGDKSVFILVAHAADCRWVAYLREQSEETGKPLTVIDSR